MLGVCGAAITWSVVEVSSPGTSRMRGSTFNSPPVSGVVVAVAFGAVSFAASSFTGVCGLGSSASTTSGSAPSGCSSSITTSSTAGSTLTGSELGDSDSLPLESRSGVWALPSSFARH
eukprot:scaffold1388_cov390-Prasinococcus_capsulatus_cf.AAC.30